MAIGKSKLDNVMAELRGLKDELRVKLHLARMDARTEWGALEPRVRKVEERLSLERLRPFRRLRRASKRLTVEDVMTPSPRACAPEDSLRRAAEIMWENDCGVAPVVDASGRLVGMITDRDICMAAYTQSAGLGGASVESAMSRGVHSCHPDDAADQVARIMGDRQIRRVPVVDAQEKLVGIVAVADLVRTHAIDQASLFETVEAVSRPRRARKAAE